MITESEMEKVISDSLCFDLDEQDAMDRTQLEINREIQMLSEVAEDE